MDKMWVCGTHDLGSIPGESTNVRPKSIRFWVVDICALYLESKVGAGGPLWGGEIGSRVLTRIGAERDQIFKE